MDLIDFSWLWRNDELSDFQLIIRPCLKRRSAHGVPLPDAAAGESAQGGMQTRSRKRRCAAHGMQDLAAVDAEHQQDTAPVAGAQAASGGVKTRRQAARQGAGSSGANQQHEQQHDPPAQPLDNDHHHQQQQQPGERRKSKRRQVQNHHQQQQQQAQGQHQQQQQQQQEQGTPHQPPPPPANQHPNRRVTRRAAAATQQGRGPDAAAAGTSGGGASSSGGGQQTAAAGAAGAAGAGPSGVPSSSQPPGTAAAAAAGAGNGGPWPSAPAGTSAAAAAAAGGGDATRGGSSSSAVGDIVLPVHAAVLTGTSEYFKLLIRGWSSGLNRVLTLEVGEDEGHAAELMIEFMYTGRLPCDVPPEELLRMIRLADQYQVSRFLSACNSSFDRLPLSSLDLGTCLGVFELPPLMLDSPALRHVLVKAKDKVSDVFGDLEKVWCSELMRDEFCRLPLGAVVHLLSSEATAVHSENTALVALAAWLDLRGGGRAATHAQKKELLSMIRIPYLTSSYLGDVLAALPWAKDLLDTRQLFAALQYSVASETTRQRLALCDTGVGGGMSPMPHYRCPRPASAVTKLSFEWSIELSQIKGMVRDARLWNRVVELHSPLHYWGGFYWQLLFNVEKTPAAGDSPDGAGPRSSAAADGGGVVMEFVGLRCHANLGRYDFWPRVVRFKANISALQTGLWDMEYVYSKGLEGPIVDGVGLGYPGFFGLAGQNLDSEAAWSRFVRHNKVSLRAEILECE